MKIIRARIELDSLKLDEQSKSPSYNHANGNIEMDCWAVYIEIEKLGQAKLTKRFNSQYEANAFLARKFKTANRGWIKLK